MFSEADGLELLEGLRKGGALLKPEHSSLYPHKEDHVAANVSKRQYFNRKDKVWKIDEMNQQTLTLNLFVHIDFAPLLLVQA